jgi:hypothetical protein
MILATWRPRPPTRLAGKGGVVPGRAPILLGIAAIFLPDTGSVQACVDKFLMVGRGMQFHRAYAAIYPASIVIYARPQGHEAKAIADPKLQRDLKLAGHQVSLVEDDRTLARALESDTVDLVLTDVPDGDRMATLAAASPSRPTVLRVIYVPTREQARTLEIQSKCRLLSSDRPDRYLRTIDDVMKARMDHRKK